MYPIKGMPDLKKGYVFGQKTFYSSFHLGTDYIIPTGTKIFAAFDGIARTGSGADTGNRIDLECTVSGQKYVIRFMHLSKFLKSGQVHAGDIIAYSGNTGLSTAPHCHLDISKNKVDVYNTKNFVDPEKFNWLINEDTMTLQDLKLKDLTEVQFNKLHDIINIHYDGWTQEIYNKGGKNAFSEWKTAYGQDTNMDKILNIMWIEQKSLYQRRLDGEKLLAGNSSPVDKSAIKDHANQIIKLVS